MATINSIFAQRSDKWSIHVIADCPPEGTLTKIMDYFKDSDKIKFTILPKRYNDWGHTPRELGKQLSKANYVIMTGDDNYYMPTLVDEINNISIPECCKMPSIRPAGQSGSIGRLPGVLAAAVSPGGVLGGNVLLPRALRGAPGTAALRLSRPADAVSDRDPQPDEPTAVQS